MDILKRRGRPRVGTGKNERLCVRMPDGYSNKLAYLAQTRGKTKTEIVLEAIDTQYKLELFRQD